MELARCAWADAQPPFRRSPDSVVLGLQPGVPDAGHRPPPCRLSLFCKYEKVLRVAPAQYVELAVQASCSSPNSRVISSIVRRISPGVVTTDRARLLTTSESAS